MSNAYNKLLEMIATVASALGEEMLEEVAFVGGCTTGLLLTDDFSKESVRYTDDVDLIINVVGYAKWVNFQERLHARGFREATNEEVNCRMRLGELKVDFMPDDEHILGFGNRWYAAGLASARPIEISEGLTIKLLTPPFFIATKLEAYLGRGNNDPQVSRDMEDILNLFDGREEIVGEIANAEKELRNFIAHLVGLLLANPDFDYAVQSTARGDRNREMVIYERLEAVSGLEEPA
jgi:predicted nucleotidyltransferase